MKIKDFVKLLEVQDLNKDIKITAKGESTIFIDIIIDSGAVNIIAKGNEVIRDE